MGTPLINVNSAALPEERSTHLPRVFVMVACSAQTLAPARITSGIDSSCLLSIETIFATASSSPSSSLSSASSLSESSTSSPICPIFTILPSGKRCLIRPVSCISAFRLTMCGGSLEKPRTLLLHRDLLLAVLPACSLPLCSSVAWDSFSRSSKLLCCSFSAFSASCIAFTLSFNSTRSLPTSSSLTFDINSLSFAFSSLSSRISFSCGFSLTTTSFLIFLALSAYRKVDKVSS
mmetsp:Transcript_30508/g.59868  ORF Transcript_30508/g.59868 Transcript_30508/m.59868 type:complete len:234 (-) Transcript_30508:241-942(-)